MTCSQTARCTQQCRFFSETWIGPPVSSRGRVRGAMSTHVHGTTLKPRQLLCGAVSAGGGVHTVKKLDPSISTKALLSQLNPILMPYLFLCAYKVIIPGVFEIMINVHMVYPPE